MNPWVLSASFCVKQRYAYLPFQLCRILLRIKSCNAHDDALEYTEALHFVFLGIFIFIRFKN